MRTKEDKAKYDVAYARDNLKRVPLDMKKAEYDQMKAMATAQGEKVNEFIKVAIRMRMESLRTGNGAGVEPTGGVVFSFEGAADSDIV